MTSAKYISMILATEKLLLSFRCLEKSFRAAHLWLITNGTSFTRQNISMSSIKLATKAANGRSRMALYFHMHWNCILAALVLAHGLSQTANDKMLRGCFVQPESKNKSRVTKHSVVESSKWGFYLTEYQSSRLAYYSMCNYLVIQMDR